MFAFFGKQKYSTHFLIRHYRKKSTVASATIRSNFIEYMIGNDHTFIRSSPLKPISDTTIPFVNAGMVQFKSVLQGQSLPPAPRAANSQKCARVGGKHNDLDTVGMDGYHHTFFEMLGNWSFGSCDKQRACKMAWELLTGLYGLNPERLYVTYFNGDNEMDLKPDLETKEIWRQLNVDESHILPFGARENFWEMGLVGPCGPCTEIHVDHVPGRQNAGQRVNMGFSDLTELWNLVFIQFNRDTEGRLHPLQQSHVDTGMGFERLVALLNGVESNYDTDLFIPLMEAIHKISGCPPYSHCFDKADHKFERDRAYRILCDHSRLLTVALADNVIPRNECKLRGVLRRALNISNNIMKNDEKLLIELTNFVAESMYFTFPEVGRNLAQVQRIIQDEADIYTAMKQEQSKLWMQLLKERSDVEGLLEFGSNRTALATAFRKMAANNDTDIVSPSLAFHLYESHGMNIELIDEMAKLLGKHFDVVEYKKLLKNVKMKSKLSSALGGTVNNLTELLSSSNMPETYCNLMYDYDPLDNGYSFPSVSAKVVGLLVSGELQNEVEGGTECGLILDRTNFYHTAGGQDSDTGEIMVTPSNVHSIFVKEVIKVGDFVIHFGNTNGRIQVGDEVVTKINDANRVACMRNHTLAHLINAEMQNLCTAPIQEKCEVHPKFLKLKYYLHGDEFKGEDAKKLEDAVSRAVENELQVNRYTVNMWQIPPGTTLVPDESYPVENIHIIDIKRGNKIVSREACCGTHVLNTKEIGKFCIVEIIKSKNTSVCAVTGLEAEEAIANSHKLSELINDLLQNVLEVKKMVYDLKVEIMHASVVPAIREYINEIMKVHKVHNNIKNFIQENSKRVSYVTFDAAATALEEGSKEVQNMARLVSELEVRRKAQGSKVVSHVMQLSELLDKVPLSKYTRLVDKPIMLFALHENELKVRCCIPQGLVSEEFNALSWIQEAMSVLVQCDQEAAVCSSKKEGQTATVQSRSITYKKKIQQSARAERCWKASDAAYKFAQSHVGRQEKRKSF